MTDETARLREALRAKFVAVIAADFDQKGVEAVERLREKDPSAYLRTVVGLTAEGQPPEPTWSRISDGELDETLGYVREVLRTRAQADGGAGAPAEPEQARALSPIPEAETVS